MSVADQKGTAVNYIIVTPYDVNLRQNDVVKRIRTGELFRITSNSSDMMTPACASLKYRQVSAEVIIP